jgi:4a-hydroxytetrahydrobiopterin dehydratase
MTKLHAEEVQTLLEQHPDWKVIDGELSKTFLFTNFSQALAFIVQVGLIAEQKNHHPLLTNVYNRVELRISTHSMKALTTLDAEWVKAVEQILNLAKP